ncbi:MAG: hypothetical protein WC966_09375 [Bradymonadales bacterium]|jgi:hypothetical protein
MLYRLLGILLVFLFSSFAFAEEVQQEGTDFVEKPAVWLGDIEEQSPAWHKAQLKSGELSAQTAELIAYGNEILLARAWNGEVFAVSTRGKVLGDLRAGFAASWWGLDGSDKLLAYDGKAIWACPSWHASHEEGSFFKIMDAADSLFIELSANQLVLAGKEKLRVIDLSSGAELSRGYGEIAGVEALPEQEGASISAFEPMGLWWRFDGVGVLRLRHLLDTALFVTRDGGKSWERMAEGPKQLQRVGAWIWDGKSKLLSEDAKDWLEVEIAQYEDWSKIFNLSSTVGGAKTLRLLNNNLPALPTKADAELAENDKDEQDGSAANGKVKLEYAPVVTGELFIDPKVDDKVVANAPIYGFLQEVNCDSIVDGACAQGHEKAKILSISDETRLVLPPLDCDEPLWTQAAQGIEILACKADKAHAKVYVKEHANSLWYEESELPLQVFEDAKLKMGIDGTVAILGRCEESKNSTSPIESGDETLAQESQDALLASRLCYTAIRQNLELGRTEAWQLERVADVYDVLPHASQTLYLTRNTDGTSKIWRTTGLGIESVVEQFDMGSYEGAKLTSEGCIELSSPTGSVLLSKEGTEATLDCEVSRRVVTEGGGVEQQNVEEERIGDDRFGLRVGGAGFFATGGVKTWSMRVEGLFPIYGGQYEIAAMFRLGGGNKANAMGYLGMVSARWRYDGFERFDFAVGAGIGFGSLCGYSKPKTEEDAEEDAVDEEGNPIRKKVSGYEKGSSLSIRYLISGIAAWKFAKNWKAYLAIELIGGSTWGVDAGAGLEVRF